MRIRQVRKYLPFLSDRETPVGIGAAATPTPTGRYFVNERYVLSSADGPFGPGSLQRFVDEDLESHYFTLREVPDHTGTLRAFAAFDVVANNSDRKSGHVLFAEGRLWAIDHGLCFHEEDKLRTVIWDYSGEPLSDEVAEGIRRLADEPPGELSSLLSAEEVTVTLWRARSLLAVGALPHAEEDGPYPPYPWPLV